MSHIPILDDHLHLDPSGKGWAALREFQRSGGSCAIVVHKPYRYPGQKDAEDPEVYYTEMFSTTLSLAREGAKRTNLGIYVALGPYPVELLSWLDAFNGDQDAAYSAFKTGIELSGEHIKVNDAIAFGEVGRPHFSVDSNVREMCDNALKSIMSKARVLGAAVIIHSESPSDNPHVWNDLGAIADVAGLERERVVKHFSPPVVGLEDNQGLFPSILARRENVIKALETSTRFMMETDYIDDPRRPGAVLGPKTVPRTTLKLIKDGVMSIEAAEDIHIRNPKRVYGIDTTDWLKP